MSRLGVYDNWGRLVAAVIDKEELKRLAFCDSFSSTSSSDASFSRHSSLSSSFDFADELNQVTASSSTRGGGEVAAFLFSGPLASYRRRKLQEHNTHQLDQLERFSLGDLQLATDHFSDENIIGRGRFGKVYKGRLADGSLVAVKKKTEEHHTSGYDQQFRAEIKVKLNTGEHPNILQLRGFCLTAAERILVYPYMVNGDVASCLRERTESEPPLDWPLRERIALSSAKGLAYLHDQCDKKVIHRDVKAANILLNEDFEAVIGDFDLAEFMEHEDTHVTTAVRGTVGHIAPEYLSTGKVSEKADVFAYGIMLLELITGQRAFDLARLANDDDVMILDWVMGLLKETTLESLVDAGLQGDHIDEMVEDLLKVALLCCQHSPEKRPKMSDVVQMLQGYGYGLCEMWKEWVRDRWLQHDWHYNHVADYSTLDVEELLNEDLEAVIGDFGLVKFMDHRDAHLSTNVEAVIGDVELARLMDHEDIHVTTTVHETISHIAPECLSTGKVSEKADVFRYGVMLLELTSGLRAGGLFRLANYADVMDWVKGLLNEKKLESLVDADQRGNYIYGKVEKLVQVALLCCHKGSPEKLPKMSDVVQMLQGYGYGLYEMWKEWVWDRWFQHDWHYNHAADYSTLDVEELSGPGAKSEIFASGAQIL